MRSIILPLLVALCAVLVSSSAAFFSVYGLSKLFAGASLSVIIMAGSLEVSKLVIAAILSRFWKRFNNLLKVYLTAAVIILVIITSAGIYGFLSNAYQITATQNSVVEKEISILDLKKDNYEQLVKEYEIERSAIVGDITELRKSLSSGIRIEYIDKETGEKISTTSRAVRQSFEAQLEDAISRRESVTNEMQTLNDSIVSLEIQALEKRTSNTAAAELGPLLYISDLTGKPMDKVINWFILTIILVFDPLAVSLVLAASQMYKKLSDAVDSPDLQKPKLTTTPSPVSFSPKINVDNIKNSVSEKVSVEEVFREKEQEEIPIEEKEEGYFSPSEIKNMTTQQLVQWHREHKKKLNK